MQHTLLDIRLPALNWLLAATAGWLFQGRKALPPLPGGDTVDWQATGDLAYFHNIEPLLYWMVTNKVLSAQIPEQLIQRWERAYFENFLRNEQYYDTLRTLLSRCEKNGIPVVVLKGPALTGRVYKDTALRTLSDIDILCFQDDLRQLVKISRDMGYTLKISGDTPASIYHIVMNHAPSQTILEFHFNPYDVILNQAGFMDLALNHRQWIDVCGVRCPVLCLEMELVFNIAHLCQHRFDVSLKHFLDIAGLIVFCRNELKRDKIETMISDFGLEQVFDLTTNALSSLGLLAHMPQPSRRDSNYSAFQEFSMSLRQMLALPDEDMLFNIRGFLWNFRIALENRKGFLNKLAYVLVKIVFPFLGSLTVYRGIRSSGDAFRYLLRHLLFYYRRLILTLTHLPKKNGQYSSAKERACAKDRITRRLQKIDRPGRR